MSSQEKISANAYPHPLLAREGWPFISLSLGAATLVTVFNGCLWSIPLWIIAVFVIQFFRDPPRVIPQEATAVLAPADGRIVKVELVEDPYLKRQALLVSVFMNVFNVHSNRSPVDGNVERVEYFPGKFFNAAIDKASEQNERNAMILNRNGEMVTVVQIAGLVARRILCYSRAGDQLRRGQRYGFIRFGSRVDVYLPTHTKVRVAVGDKVKASSTVIADL